VALRLDDMWCGSHRCARRRVFSLSLVQGLPGMASVSLLLGKRLHDDAHMQPSLLPQAFAAATLPHCTGTQQPLCAVLRSLSTPSTPMLLDTVPRIADATLARLLADPLGEHLGRGGMGAVRSS
jgi:hypothetical protein